MNLPEGDSGINESKPDPRRRTFPYSGRSGEGGTTVTEIKGISSLDAAREEDLSFLGNSKYKAQVQLTSASVVLLPEDYDGQPKENQLFVRVKEPSRSLAVICRFLEKRISPAPSPGIHETAFVHPEAKIAEGVFIGPFAFVGSHVTIGPNSEIGSHCHLGDHAQIGESCRIYPGVKILSRCFIGDRVILNAGVVIGSEGYGFEQVGENHEKVPHRVLSLLRKASKSERIPALTELVSMRLALGRVQR